MSDRIQNKVIQNLRESYQSGPLLLHEVPDDPFSLFDQWFKTAVEQEITEPNAMILATVNASGQPAARVVLLKEYDEHGFVFYTNFESRKGRELSDNPNCSLVFNWLDLHRQIRIEGQATPVAEEEAIQYYQSRPKGSQIGAWASPQSQEIENRDFLENRFAKVQEEYADRDLLPKPSYWGGYLIQPSYLEFWQGRESRLHDRIFYHKSGLNTWKKGILAP